MKTRSGFVSNSSSSSFVIKLKNISGSQLQKILDPDYSSQNYGEDSDFPYTWSIDLDGSKGTVEGYTSMDNFDMGRYLEELGVPDNAITWGE
jgi:hypothetical protein